MVWTKEAPLAEGWESLAVPLEGTYDEQVLVYNALGLEIYNVPQEPFIKALPLTSTWTPEAPL